MPIEPLLAPAGKVVALAAASALVIACGRSEDIGWAGREMPDTIGQAEAAEAEPPAPVNPPTETAPAQTSPAESTRDARVREYRQLIQALAAIQAEAFRDPELAERWSRLTRDVDAAIIAGSDYHRELLQRRAEIQAAAREAERSGEPMSQQRRTELARDYRRIEMEFARKRNELIRRPPFLRRLERIQADLYERMRELAPDRRAEINRLAELEGQLFGSDTTGSGPGARSHEPASEEGRGQR